MPLRQLIFKRAYHRRVTSFDLCRQIILTRSKSRPYVLHTKGTLLLFFLFNEPIIIVQKRLLKLQCTFYMLKMTQWFWGFFF